MKKILHYLQKHFKETYHPAILIWLLLLLAGGMWWRYGLKNDPFFRNSDLRLFWGAILYLVPYLGTVIVVAWAKGQWGIFKQQGFWWLSAFLCFVLYANQFMLFYKEWVLSFPQQIQYFSQKVFFNLHTVVFYLGVPLLYWYWKEQEPQASFYGLTSKGFDPKPYVLMLAIMIPLLAWASFQPEFLKAYPRYKAGGSAEAYWQVSNWATVGVYELSYVLQFVFLELFFRGFMVMKLEKYLGQASVFPMVAVYCFIHFGKPMPEALGSIFGGYILGVIALYSRSVLGGVFIHVGVALGMELFAYWQLMD